MKPVKSTPCLWHNLTLIHCLSGVLLLGSEHAYSREFYFTPNSLEGDSLSRQDIDLSLFSKSNAQLPGTYISKVRLNKQHVPDESITYVSNSDGSLRPLFTRSMLRKWGIKVDEYPELVKFPEQESLKEPIDHYIPYSSAELDFSSMTLNVSMPQTAVKTINKEIADPSRWDDGVTVVFTDYSFSGNQRDEKNSHVNTQYLNLRNGVNLGGWRVRNYSTWNNNEQNQSWDAINTWLQHDVRLLHGQFIAGESSTRGEVFDSLQYRGVNIASDELMLPYNQRGYAPTIRGIANSNAEVSIRQNGYLIYQSTVAPGPFEINDLYSTTNSGDLEVTVKEADGSEHRFTQPYSGIAIMQRPGHLKYEFTAGRYRADNSDDANEPLFTQGSLIYGINNLLTMFGGMTASDKYQSVNLGTGIGLGEWGSISADATYAHAVLDNDEQHNGQSYRLMYTGLIETTDTNFTLASYRYSTQGYYSFADANEKYTIFNEPWSFTYNKRSRIQASISQTVLGSSIYLNGYQQDYWGSGNKERSLSLGISGAIKGINVNVAYSYNKNSQAPGDQMLSLGVSIPLDRWLPHSWANYNISNTKNGYTNQNLSLSGTLLDDNRLSYTLQQSHTNHDGGDSSSIYSGYRSQYANLNAGFYTSSNDSQQINYGVNGGIVIHPGGITLSQPLGNEFAIVDTNDASGIGFTNQRGIQTDWFGNAIIPSLTPYQENTIRLDTTSLPEEVDSNDTAVTVVPTRQAAVKAHFDARKGYRVLVTLTRPDGRLIPFGALGSIDGTGINGIVDDSGTLYLSGVEEKLTLTVKWGNSAQQQCQAITTLPIEQTMRIYSVSAVCQ